MRGTRVMVSLMGLGVIISGWRVGSLRTGTLAWWAASGADGVVADVPAGGDGTGSVLAAAGQAPPAVIRPRAYVNDGFSDPQQAVDKNPATASGGHPGGRICHTHCVGVNRVTCTWVDFPAGYRPMELRVKWRAGGGVAIVGEGRARVEAWIEYSLDGGGSWVEMERWMCEQPRCELAAHEVGVPLSGAQATGLVQVRATVEVTLLQCGDCQTNSTNVDGDMSVYDIRIVAERPEFRLFLDVDGDFDPAHPESDIDLYVPGARLDGESLPVPSSGTTIQTVEVVAGYVLPDGKLAKPAEFIEPGEGTPRVSYPARSSRNTSRFRGIAMNCGTSTGLDFYLPVIRWGFVDDGGMTARVPLECRDYGGMTVVVGTTQGGNDTATLRIPQDEDGNLLPDGGWLDADGNWIDSAGIAPDADDDLFPSTTNGVNGDGLSAYEEYRGFVVLSNGIERHRRTNPSNNKDLFIWSDVFSDNLYDATHLPFPKHRITNGGKDPSRRINFNYTNNGLGGNIPGHVDQRCLTVFRIEEFRDCCYGQNLPPRVQPWTPNNTDRIEIYIQSIRWASPPNMDRFIVDSFDDAGIRHVLGHEVGHGINIAHRDYLVSPPPPLSVMIINYITPGGDRQAWQQRWNNLPHNYHEGLDIIPWLRLK